MLIPFVSDAQRKFLFANEPEIAKRWAAHTPKGKELPEHVSHKKKHEKRAYALGAQSALRQLALFTGIVLLNLVSRVTFAADAVSSQKWWQALLEPVFYLVGSALAVFVAVGLRKLIKYVETKTKIDVPASIEELIKDKALLLIAAAEEKAENKFLHDGGVKTPGAEKLSWVLEELQDFTNKMGYGEEWRKEKLTTLVEGLLHLNRVDNEGVGSSTLDSRGATLKQTNN